MSTSNDSLSSGPGASRRWLWFSLKWLLFAAVMVFVGRRAWELWQEQGDLSSVRLKWGWLSAASVVYAVGWLPSVWFWRELMQQLGAEVNVADTARAYYCGHLGKYIPGKAMALVIRSALLKGRGCGAATAAVTATVETLLMMGAGLAVAAALAPLLLTDAMMAGWPRWIRDYAVQPGVSAGVVLVALVISLPLLARLLTLIAVRMTPQSFLDGQAEVKVSVSLVAKGVAAFVLSWACHGLSLGLTIRAITTEPLNLANWPVWTGAVSAATAIGFAVLFAPGGMGVREGLLIEVLQIQPDVGPQQAVVAAVLLRMVWFVTELGVAGVLYFVFAGRRVAA